MESSENEKKQISPVDFFFICRICFMRRELRLFEEEKTLWSLFQSLMKIEVNPIIDFPKNVCSDCINKLKEISLFIEISRYTNLYFVNEVFSMGVEGGSFPKPEPAIEDYGNETARYCRTCLSAAHLSPFEEKISLLQLFQEITLIDVTTGTETNSICYRCINELEKASTFLKLSKGNNELLQTLATADVKKEVSNTDDDGRLEGRSELKVEIIDFMKTDEFRHLHTAIDIKEEVVSRPTDTKRFGCNDCGKRFAYKYSLRTHLRTHTGKKLFGCHHCDKRYARKRDLQYHLFTHTGEKPFKCGHCEKQFSQRSTLRNHLLTHTGEKPFKCDFCEKQFTLKRGLRSHLRTHTEKKIGCGYCDKKFVHERNLRSHLLTHTGEKPFECDRCDKKFARKYDLKSHSLTHTEGKPFKCNICDKRFSQNKLLRYHLRTHTGDRCDKRFAFKNYLRFHLRSHTGDKPFKCNYCNEKFVRDGNLRSHLRTHTGEKPFTCDYCDKRFTRISSLRRHAVTHTGGK